MIGQGVRQGKGVKEAQIIPTILAQPEGITISPSCKKEGGPTSGKTSRE